MMASGAGPSGFEGGVFVFPRSSCSTLCYRDFPSFSSASSAAAPFAQRNLSILLDTQVLEEQDHAQISPFAARLPLHSPHAVTLKANLRIEPYEARPFSLPFYSLDRSPTS